MIEWKFNKLIAKNPKLVRIIENSTHALIKKLVVLMRMMKKINIISSNFM